MFKTVTNKRRTYIQKHLQLLARICGCFKCNTHSHDVKYCWHHPGKKNFRVTAVYSMAKVAEELKLCVPMCMSCHSKLHMTGNKHHLGYKHSQKTKDQMSKSRIGRKFTKVHRANI